MKSWFSKIETAEQAEKAIKEVSWSLYFLAGLNLLIVLFLHRPAVLQEVFLLVVLGFSSSERAVGVLLF